MLTGRHGAHGSSRSRAELRRSASRAHPLCPSNLPFSRDDEGEGERGGQAHADEGAELESSRAHSPTLSRGGGGVWRAADEEGPGAGAELLAHGSAFVGRHLEMHAMITSCLHNQLTAVYGDKGAGKSALILEAARYLRQRNRFPHGIFCCSLEGLRRMKDVRTRLGTQLNIPARTAPELYDLMARYSSCLLIFDRCEDAIRHKSTQFYWFLSQLLQLSSVRVVISSQTPMPEDAFPRPAGGSAHGGRHGGGDATIQWSAVRLSQMRQRDSALLLLESCERTIDLQELGFSEDVGAPSLLDALTSHPLLARIGGMPAAVRWAARRLADVTVPALLEQLLELSPGDFAATVQGASQQTLGLAPHLSPTHGRRKRPSTDHVLGLLPSPAAGMTRSGSSGGFHARSHHVWPAHGRGPLPSPGAPLSASMPARLSPISSPGDTSTEPPLSCASSVGGGNFRLSVNATRGFSPPPPSPSVILPSPSPRPPYCGGHGGSHSGGHGSGGHTASHPGGHGQHHAAQQQQQQQQHLRAARQAVQEMRAYAALASNGSGGSGGGESGVSPELSAELRALVSALQDMTGGSPPQPAQTSRGGHQHPQSLRQRSHSGGSGRRDRSHSGSRKLSWESRQVQQDMMEDGHYDLSPSEMAEMTDYDR